MLAVEEINAAGGIKALAGAKIDAMLGDAQSTPDGGTAEVEKMNAAEVSCIVGGYATSICLAASQAAARYDLPYVVDVGVADSIVTRGPEEHLPLRPRLRRHRQDRARQSGHDQRRGRQAGEDGDDRARGLAVRRRPCQAAQRATAAEGLRDPGDDRASDADPRLQQRRAQDQAQNPDLVIPANYYNEYVLLARTMQQQRVRPKGIYSVLGGAASSYNSSRSFPKPPIHHGLQSLVQPEESQGAGAEKEGRGEGPVLHLRGLHELLRDAAPRRRHRARRLRRPRQDHRRAREPRPSPAT